MNSAFEQLSQLGNGDFDGAEQGITIHRSAGYGPAEAFMRSACS
ncbi:hypothetical protein [Rhodococcus sp. WAY2]|nr:hypothetical protein [Rhodococcus sp. WAY2]QHE68625.1 hypothetical protein GFS60_02159 [Rhodococcus sp. WAY2]